jgi:hypothetical protein
MRPVPGRPGQYHALWTGKQAVSCFTPDVNYQHGKLDARETNCWSGDDCVLVVKGEYLMGIMAKDQLGNKMQGLLHIIMNDVSPEVTRDFINNCQKVINYWLLHRGFSIGIGDSEADAKTVANVAKIIDDAKKHVQSIVQKAQKADELKRQPGQSLIQSFESLVNGGFRRRAGAASTPPSWHAHARAPACTRARARPRLPRTRAAPRALALSPVPAQSACRRPSRTPRRPCRRCLPRRPTPCLAW